MVTTGGGYSDEDLERASDYDGGDDDSSSSPISLPDDVTGDDDDDSTGGSGGDSSGGSLPVNTPPDVPGLPENRSDSDSGTDSSSSGSSGGYSGGSSGSSTRDQPTSGYSGGSSSPSDDSDESGGDSLPVNTPDDVPGLPENRSDPDGGTGSSGGYSGGVSGSSTRDQPTSGYSGGSSSPSTGRETTSPDEIGGRYRSDEERQAAEQIAENTELDIQDIARVRRRRVSEMEGVSPSDVDWADSPDDARYVPELTDAARLERVAEQYQEMGEPPSDGRLDPNATGHREAARQRALYEDITADDLEIIETDEGEQVALNEDFRRSHLRQQVASQSDTLDPEDVEIEETDDGELTANLTQEARGEFAVSQAAEQDPLRDDSDFIAEFEGDEVSVRRRAAPFFEDQREALGLDTPEESGLRRSLQSGRDRFNDWIEAGIEFDEEARPNSLDSTTETMLGEWGIDTDDAPLVTDADITRGAGSALNLPGGALAVADTAERAADVASARVEQDVSASAPSIGDVFGADPDAYDEEIDAQVESTRQSVNELADVAQSRPGVVLGAVGTGAAFGVGSGVAIGRGATAARGIARTAGGQKIDAGDLVNPSTRRVYDGDGSGDRFPTVEDRQLGRENPPEAIRQQADEYTPDELDQAFQQAGETEGSVLFKALDAEPEGPGSGRSSQGLRTQEGEYESPGAFVGPELSPNFLRLSGDSSLSLRPGLPDTGGSPTAVAVRTEVERPEADTMEGFRQEMVDRAGETTARTKPDSAFNLEEAEAVIPGDSTFRDIGGGVGRNLLRRAGIGSDYYTEIGGQRVPIRTVAPDDGPSTLGGRTRQFLDDDDAQLGATDDASAFSGRTLRSIGERPRSRTDRPTAIFGSGSPGYESSERAGSSSSMELSESWASPSGSSSIFGSTSSSGGLSTSGGSGFSSGSPTSPSTGSPSSPADYGGGSQSRPSGGRPRGDTSNVDDEWATDFTEDDDTFGTGIASAEDLINDS